MCLCALVPLSAEHQQAALPWVKAAVVAQAHAAATTLGQQPVWQLLLALSIYAAAASLPPKQHHVVFGPPCSVRLVEDASAAEGEPASPRVEWAGDSRWMEVSIGLVGEAGAMRALGPTLRLPSQVSQHHSLAWFQPPKIVTPKVL